MQNKAEELKLDNTLDAMIQRVNDIKSSINQFLWKLDHEHETLTWSSVLDSFALLSSQINSFQKLLASDRTAQLKNYVFVPLMLDQVRDVEIERLTEGRVQAFNHEIVPDYLRTKPEMEVEKKIKTISDKTSGLSADMTNRQLNSFNRACQTLCTQIQNKREEWKNEDSSRRLAESTKHEETVALVAATAHGKGLFDPRPHPVMMPQMRHDMPPVPHPVMHRAPTPTINIAGAGGRMSQVRPNVRMQPYPYGRP